MNSKETIYVDVDDEITHIIDKVQSSDSKIVALVLPKRAAVMQSIVNMKLLKKSAQKAGKNIVLITSEPSLLPMAGVVGLHVAKTLQSKPVIPPLPNADDKATEELGGEATNRPAVAKPIDEDETIELDNTEPALAGAAAAAVAPIKKKFGGHGSKLRIPNFEKFRLRLFLGIGLVILLIIGWFMAFVVMPKAEVVITTDSSSFQTSVNFTADTAATQPDLEQKIIPAKQGELKKTNTEKAEVTGEKNVGTKASGTMTAVNCTDDDVTIPAGTTFTNSGFVFATDQAVEVPASNFTSGGSCKKDRNANIPVTAVEPGDKYNLSSGREYSSNIASTLTGTGSNMSGGTTKIIKVVGQSDIDALKDVLKSRGNEASVGELKSNLSADGYFAMKETLVTSEPKVTASPNVGEEATEVTVTGEITYTMLGIKQDSLSELVKAEVEGKIDKSKQVILDDGIDEAVFRIDSKPSATKSTVNIQTLAYAGPQLDENAIKEDVRGKKLGDAEKAVLARPGIKDVEIKYSPFWVYSTPKAAKKVTVKFESNAAVQNAGENEEQTEETREVQDNNGDQP